jgi:hypothetical protein
MTNYGIEILNCYNKGKQLFNKERGASFEKLKEFGVKIRYDIGELSFNGNIIKC